MRRTIFSEGEYYHLYNRGVDKRIVFTEPREYERFLSYLMLLNDAAVPRLTYAARRDHLFEAKPLKMQKAQKPLIAIGAYCLMPNHFHLYVTPLVDDGISRFMHRVQTAYTMYFNEKHRRTGSLFQGPFKAQHVDREAYARYLFSYIHLNPAKLRESKWKELGVRDLKGMRSFLHSYPYSSLEEYSANTHRITHPSFFPEYLRSMRNVERHIDEWLSSRSNFRGLAL